MTEGVFITAACKRIGRYLATRIAAEGYYVYLHYHNIQTDAEETLKSIKDKGGDGCLVQCDLGQYDDVDGLLPRSNNPDHPIRHVINNASQFKDDSFLNFTAESFTSHQNVNLRAPIQLARSLYSLIPHGQKGSVINILDSKVFSLNADFMSYSLSKYALFGATEMMAQALSPKIRANGIAPGLTLISSTQSPENFALASHLNFTGEPIKPEDIAETALLLLKTTSINGATIPVDGGQKMMNFTADIVNVAKGILNEKD